MGTVETRSKALSERSSPSLENAKGQCSEQEKNELREALCALKGGEGTTPENGVGFSGHGNQGLGDDGVVEVVKSKVFETKVSVQRDFGDREMGNDCQGLADSEMNGVSSLLKMRGSGRSGVFSYGSGSDSAEKLKSVYSSEKRATVSGGGLFGVGVEERKDWKKSKDEIIIEDDRDRKIVTIDVPIAETSENKDAEMEDLSDEGQYGFSVGDFIWGKIKSHPWWPGRIYDPSHASDYALRLRQKNRLLVAYFGDGTFAWCHPSQLKPFEENFEDMVVQSSSRAFVFAVQEAVNEVGTLLNLKMSYSCAANINKSESVPPLAKNYGIKEGVLVLENGIERLSAVLIDPTDLLQRVKRIAKILAIANILELEILKARLSVFYLSRGGYKLPTFELPQAIPGLEDSSIDETEDVGNSKGAVEAPVQGPFEEYYCTLPMSPKSGELNHSQGISGNRPNHRRKQKSIAEILGEDKDVFTKNKERDATEEVMVRKKRKGSEDTLTSKPVQKRKGFLSITDKIVPSAESDASGTKENSDMGALSLLKEKKEAFGNENTISGSKKETNEDGKAKKQNDKGSLSRERKKSKYLSPPFTTSISGQWKGDIETESPKFSSKTYPSEPKTRAAGQHRDASLPLNCYSDSEAFQENFSKELPVGRELPDSLNYQIPEDDENKTIDPAKIQAPSGHVLSELRYAAINPQIPRDIFLANFVEYISVYRSSLYRHGSYHKVYKKYQPGRKRKKPELEVGMSRKDQNKTDHIPPNNDSEPRKRRKNERTSGLPEGKRATEAKFGKKGTDEKASPAELFVSFGPGSPLPSKSDLITLYSKFGALNEAETAMFSSNHTARVSFLKTSDAEKALNHSQSKSPFSSEVSFQIEYLSARSESEEHPEKSMTKASSAKKKDKTSSSEISKLNFIKQKLQRLTSMVEALDGKSPDMKTKLESEMKGLLADVNKMVESSSS